MEVSWIILICGAGTLAIGLLFLFFGYNLARFLLPLCGVLVALGLLWALLLPVMRLNSLDTWLFMGGAGVSLYILLFFFKRVAGFFVGLLGAALMLLFIVCALNLYTVPYLYPACFALCAASALLALVYKKAGVAVFTSLLGGCMAAFAGLYLYYQGVDPAAFAAGVPAALWAFLIQYRYLVAGVALVLSVAGILAQLLVTSRRQVLSGDLDEASLPSPPKKPRKERALPPAPAEPDPPEMSV